MSKSKGNLVAPEDILDTEGADALRLAHLFVGPPATTSTGRAWASRAASASCSACGALADPASDAVPPADGRRRRRGRPGRPPPDPADHRRLRAVVVQHRGRRPTWSSPTCSTSRARRRFAVDTLLQLLAPAAPAHHAPSCGRCAHPGEHVHELSWPVADAGAGRGRHRHDGRAGQRQGEGTRSRSTPASTRPRPRRWPSPTSSRRGAGRGHPEAGHRPAAEARQRRRLASPGRSPRGV